MASRLIAPLVGMRTEGPAADAIDAAVASAVVLFGLEGLSPSASMPLFAAGVAQGVAGAYVGSMVGAQLASYSPAGYAVGDVLGTAAGAGALGYALGDMGAVPYRPAAMIGALTTGLPAAYDMLMGTGSKLDAKS